MDSFTAAPHNEPKHRCPGMKEGGGVWKRKRIPLLSSLEPDFFPLTAP